ncbi:MAG: hypothetical protein ACRD1P_10620 [Thermoanaerobaculia bacterium]
MREADNELTPSEQDALAALRRDLPPPEALEGVVVKTLAAQGLLRVRGLAPRRPLPLLALLAGAAALFSAGILIGVRAKSSQAPSASLSRYVLFLEGSGEPSAEEEARRVADYKLWARQVSKAGHLIVGEKLFPEARRVGGGSGPAGGGESVRGFFEIAARNDAEALEIARGCPHLRYGGWIVIRKVAPV